MHARWRVAQPRGERLVETAAAHTRIDGGTHGSEVHQVFGTWTGRLVTDDGVAIRFLDLQGFAEEARQRW